MKKHLIAAGVVAAFAAPAMAQNVSFYGLIGADWTNVSKSTSNADTSTVGSGDGALSTTVFGMKGSEDLGGGLKATFQFEGNLKNSGQVGNNAYDAADGAVFNRQAYIGLESAKFGSVKLGRTGDVIDSVEGYSNFVQLFDTEAADENGIGNKNAGTVRYDSPAFNGVKVSASYSNDGRATSTASASTFANQKVVTYGVAYNQGPVTVGVAEGTAGYNASTSASSTTKPKIQTVYAGYVLGAADIRVQRTQENDTNNGKNKTTEFAVKYDLGSGMYVVGHWENYDVNDTSTTDYKQMGVLLAKSLSKRTTVFVGYKDRNLDDGSKTDETTTTIGIQHKF
jgi:predicted porin